MSTLSLPITTDSFDHYMTQVNSFALLDRDEEHALAIRYRDTGDIESAHRLITANLRFVVKVALEYRNYGVKLLDLIQEGNIGLMMAVRKFDPDRGLRLITYAVWWIRAYIQNYILRSWSLVKIGTTQAQKKLFFKLSQTRNALRNLTGDADAAEIARQLDVRDSDVEEMTMRMGGRDQSIDLELVEGEGYTLSDSLADTRASQEELVAEQQEQSLLNEQVQRAMKRLNERERHIVEQRILADEPQTLQELADHYSISRERVRQLEKNALQKLKGVFCPTT
ncbi:MAG: RNA polymerase sigma factor RpoH [Desulfuromonadaceae bacterium]|nr:RNA polymerase sigma factor RpoH [Desulfuromonadaceae bacterium]